jgi:hypothetical protein
MTHLRATVALFALLFCACSEPRPDAEDLLRKIGPEALRSDAARLTKTSLPAVRPSLLR